MPDAPSRQAELYCPACRGVVRPGARFCFGCGYPFTDAPPTKPAESDPPAVTAATGRAGVAHAGWLFGLLLLSSLVAGEFSRSHASPWIEVIVDGVDAFFVLVFAGIRHRETFPLLGPLKIGIRDAAQLVAVALAFVIAMSLYFKLIGTAIPLYRMSDPFRAAGWPLWSIVVVISIVPAVIEELACRGVIQSALEGVLSSREALVVQAAMFSVLHLLPLMFPSHFAMGLCFGYLRLRSRSLYPGMVLHGAWNALVLWQELS